MTNVYSFPSGSTPSMVDPPEAETEIEDVVDLRAYAIGLEHENADLRKVVSDQAVRLARKKRIIESSNVGGRIRATIAVVVAFCWGLSLDPPSMLVLHQGGVGVVSDSLYTETPAHLWSPMERAHKVKTSGRRDI